MITGSCTARCKRQAAPESASQMSSQSSGFRETKSATGAAIHRLRHSKQSISLPAKLCPKRTRNRTIKSAGPSSLASRCVIRQVARAARTNLIQKVVPVIRQWAEPEPNPMFCLRPCLPPS